MYEVKEGDFILSGIDARNGAFGIAPKELDGAIVTNDFWYFEIDDNIISKKLFLEINRQLLGLMENLVKKVSDGKPPQKNKGIPKRIKFVKCQKVCFAL